MYICMCTTHVSFHVTLTLKEIIYYHARTCIYIFLKFLKEMRLLFRLDVANLTYAFTCACVLAFTRMLIANIHNERNQQVYVRMYGRNVGSIVALEKVRGTGSGAAARGGW